MKEGRERERAMGWKMGERVEREWSEEDERPLGKIRDYVVWSGDHYMVLHPLSTCVMV